MWLPPMSLLDGNFICLLVLQQSIKLRCVCVCSPVQCTYSTVNMFQCHMMFTVIPSQLFTPAHYQWTFGSSTKLPNDSPRIFYNTSTGGPLAVSVLVTNAQGGQTAQITINVFSCETLICTCTRILQKSIKGRLKLCSCSCNIAL